ncbi:MAG: hypothetical protein RBG13Loki_0486 [Promethearchaeota archaeon CR_4]|nr:MAG: hypothetical protein RBG13Loki_0486 [Candidatus Lokiarchaeota archaeon CR_4]
MEDNLILKIRSKNSLVGKLTQLCHEFLPHLCYKFGIEIFIEKVIDGALIFFKSMKDFINFHQILVHVNIPEFPSQPSSRLKKDNIVEIFVEIIKLPHNVTIDDLMPGVATCYRIISKNIEVEKLSATTVIFRYLDANSFVAIFDFLKVLWDQNNAATSVMPKME